MILRDENSKGKTSSAMKRVKILIGICSCQHYHEKQKAVRETWLTKVPPEMEAVFFVGNGDGEGAIMEDKTLVLPVRDDYDGLPKKVQAFFQYALANYEFDHLFKCDDDTYLLSERLYDLLLDAHEFVGSQDWWPSHADGGAGYLLSRRAVETAAQAPCPESGKEDVWITELLRNAGFELHPTTQLVQNHHIFPTQNNRIITVHWCRPEIMREIHGSLFENKTTAVKRLFYARHSAWHGYFKLLENGVFLGGGGNPNGHWEFQDQEEYLIINWFAWPKDILKRTESGYANADLKLEILRDESVKTNVNDSATVRSRACPPSTPNKPDVPKKTKILIGICSCHRHADKRAAIRETWMQNLPEQICAVFFVGQDGETNEPNVISLPTRDDYEGLPGKVQAFFRHALAHHQFDYLFKCDDDSYVCSHRLFSLVEIDQNYIGDHDHATRVNYGNGGAGYLLSRKAVEVAAHATCPETGPEDAWVGKVLRSAGMRLRPSWRLRADCIQFPDASNDLITAHWCNPTMLKAIHEGVINSDASRATMSFQATHTTWSGPFKLLRSQLFVGGYEKPHGRWEFINSGESLVLHWFHWGKEILHRTDFGYAGSQLRLELCEKCK